MKKILHPLILISSFIISLACYSMENTYIKSIKFSDTISDFIWKKDEINLNTIQKLFKEENPFKHTDDGLRLQLLVGLEFHSKNHNDKLDWRQMLFHTVVRYSFTNKINLCSDNKAIENNEGFPLFKKCNNLLLTMAKIYPQDAKTFFNLQKENACNKKIEDESNKFK